MTLIPNPSDQTLQLRRFTLAIQRLLGLQWRRVTFLDLQKHQEHPESQKHLPSQNHLVFQAHLRFRQDLNVEEPMTNLMNLTHLRPHMRRAPQGIHILLALPTLLLRQLLGKLLA